MWTVDESIFICGWYFTMSEGQLSYSGTMTFTFYTWIKEDRMDKKESR